MPELRDALEQIFASGPYQAWARTSPIDAGKVAAELAGDRRPQPGSAYGRGFVRLARLAATPAPAPPLPPLVELGRNVMFTAWAPHVVLNHTLPAHWKVAVSADPAYDTAVRAAAPKLKARGNLLAVWGVQTQVGAERINQLGLDLDADYLIFQAETPDEYDTAIAAGATLIVGNPNSWTQAQRDDAIARYPDLWTLFEVYSNMGSPWPSDASSRRVQVSSEVLGVGWGDTPYQLPDYRPHTPDGVWSTISVYLAETMSTESWEMLP